MTTPTLDITADLAAAAGDFCLTAEVLRGLGAGDLDSSDEGSADDVADLCDLLDAISSDLDGTDSSSVWADTVCPVAVTRVTRRLASLVAG